MSDLALPQRWFKVIAIALVLFLMGGICPPLAMGAELQLESPSYILMEPLTGEILLEENSHQRMEPASVTKLMTLVVAAEALEAGKAKLTDKVVVSENAWKMGGAQIYLEKGEEMSLNDLLASIAVESANDSCVAVAEHLYGSHEEFVQMMNLRAEELGMKDTHYINSHGLHADGHYTSAYDQAILAQHALKLPLVLDLSSIKEYDIRGGEMHLYNHNKLLWWYPGADGFKTGWHNEAKYCMVATAEREGFRLVAVNLGAPLSRGNFRDCMKLMSYGFARYSYQKLVEKGQGFGTLTVIKGRLDSVDVVAGEKGGAILPKGKEGGITTDIELPPSISAPVSQGQKLGELVIYNQNKVLQRVELVAAQDVERGTIPLYFKRFLTNMTRLN